MEKTSIKEKLSVSFHTLGCKLNFSETSTISQQFSEKGFKQVQFGKPADITVINTCTVTNSADKKSKQAINKIRKLNPDTFIIVTGCLAQLKSNEISEIEGVDLVLGNQDKFDIFKYYNKFKKKKETPVYSCEIEEETDFKSAFSLSGRTRSFLKVQDGCDYPCTYCTIPEARGKSRNKSIEELCNDAEIIAQNGFKEIILTGVNIGDFGKSNGESFFCLLKNLEKVEGIERIRISSIEPNLLNDEIIQFTKESNKFLSHFHIPLQSGSDKILKLMKRRYNTEIFINKIRKINELLPDAFIGIDVIVGFPGETDDDFNETYSMLERLDIAFIHVFSYSDRDGTPASKMTGKINPQIIKQRSQKLNTLARAKQNNFYKKNIGTIHKVLVESSRSGDSMFGFTDNYIKAEFPYSQDLANKIITAKITGINEKGNAIAEIISS